MIVQGIRRLRQTKWISALPENFLIQNISKIDAKSNIFVEPLLI